GLPWTNTVLVTCRYTTSRWSVGRGGGAAAWRVGRPARIPQGAAKAMIPATHAPTRRARLETRRRLGRASVVIALTEVVLALVLGLVLLTAGRGPAGGGPRRRRGAGDRDDRRLLSRRRPGLLDDVLDRLHDRLRSEVPRALGGAD